MPAANSFASAAAQVVLNPDGTCLVTEGEGLAAQRIPGTYAVSDTWLQLTLNFPAGFRKVKATIVLVDDANLVQRERPAARDEALRLRMIGLHLCRAPQ